MEEKLDNSKCPFHQLPKPQEFWVSGRTLVRAIFSLVQRKKSPPEAIKDLAADRLGVVRLIRIGCLRHLDQRLNHQRGVGRWLHKLVSRIDECCDTEIGMIVTHPALAQELLGKDCQDSIGRVTPADKKLRALVGSSLTAEPASPSANEGRDEVKRFLKLDQPWLQALIINEAKIIVGTLKEKNGQNINAYKLAHTYTYNIILKACLGDNAVNRELITALEPIWQQLNEQVTDWVLDFSDPAKMPDALAQLKIKMDALVTQAVENIRTNGDGIEGKSQAARLLLKGIKVEKIVYDLEGLLVAGHLTSASAIAWMIYYLACNPECRDRVYAELRLATTLPMTQAHRERDFPYTSRVIKETLRLGAVIPIIGRGRKGDSDIIVEGLLFRVKAMIQIWVKLMMQNSKVWENPDQFDPERFLPDRFQRDQKASYMPFGYGETRCVGEQFAQTEMVTMLWSLADKGILLDFVREVLPERGKKVITIDPADNDCPVKVRLVA